VGEVAMNKQIAVVIVLIVIALVAILKSGQPPPPPPIRVETKPVTLDLLTAEQKVAWWEQGYRAGTLGVGCYP
jgi:hypothetical protein